MTAYQNRRAYRTDLSDEQWAILQPLLPPASQRGRPRELELRAVINAILYVVVGGIQWRLLPHDYPAWPSVYYYFRTWRDTGKWQRLHDTLRAEARKKVGRFKQPTAGCMDSQSVKSTPVVKRRGYDAGKKINGRKRHLLVDTMGWIMAVLVTTAAVQDRDGARILLRRLTGACKKLRLIWVDGGYRGKLLDWVSQHFRFSLQPVLRSDKTTGFRVLPHRWVVERTFGWLVANRRLAKDYEALPNSSESMIHIAMIRLMVRRLAR